MKNSIFIRTFFLISLVLVVTESFGQTDLKSKLFKDFVKIENGKYTAELNGFVVAMKANTLEVKIIAACPTSVMSRDNFILTLSAFGNSIIANVLKNLNDQGNDELVLIRRDKAIGPADITIKIEMDAKGLTYKTTAKGNKVGFEGGNTLSWDQFFLEN
jgi:hypothetical protein